MARMAKFSPTPKTAKNSPTDPLFFMSKNLQEQATTTTTPTNWFVNIAGGIRQLTAAAFNSLIGGLLGTQTHAATDKSTPVDGDELPLSDSAASNATKKLSWANLKATAKTYFDTVYAALSHAARHKSGGADAIKLDELDTPTDVTTLNATTSAHGLLPKLGGGTTNFLRADGTWSAPAGGGGGSASDPNVGYVASDGNDSTGDGSPGAPYLTAQAAYNAGFRAIRGGVGSFGDIACAGAAALSLTGVGKDKTIFGNITATAGFVFGNGSSMLSVNSIVYAPGDGAAGANGDPGTPGSNGDNGGGGTAATASQVVGIYCAGVIQLIGGAGGSGGAGADGDGSSINGGTGGAGGTGGPGADLSIKDSIVDGGCVSQGGNGGAGGVGGWGSTGTGGAGGYGGNGGGPGSLTLTNVVTPSVTVTAAAGGAGGAGGTGGAMNGFAGGDGMASTDSTIAPRSATIAGTWFGGTYP